MGEAVTNILCILKKQQPNSEILTHLFLRPVEERGLLATLCCFWLQYCKEKLTTVLSSFIGNQSKPEDADLRRSILKHSPQLLASCKDLFYESSILKSYKKLKQTCQDIEISSVEALFTILQRSDE